MSAAEKYVRGVDPTPGNPASEVVRAASRTSDRAGTPSRLPAIVAAPEVTDEQRQRLRRAIDAYRAEA